MTLIGESVSVRVTRNTVEVFFHGNRVAVHPREAGRKRDPVVITSHMPENHRQYLTYTKDDFQSWASTIGPNTEKSRPLLPWNPERLLSRVLSPVSA